MKIIQEPVIFEWDKGNSDKNLIRHKVTNQETEEVFKDEENFIFEDEKHSTVEKRYGLFGRTTKDRLLSIVFTIRKERVRVITARDISRRERRYYEKIKKNSQI